MHTSPASSAVRTQEPGLPNVLPQDVWIRLVVNHISLREGRAITSLACVNRVFSQWLSPYRQPVARYSALDNAGNGTPQQALHLCMSTLYDLADVTPAHRLELFLKVGTVLGNHFSAEAIEPHIDTLLAGIQHLPRADKPDALLDLVQRYSSLRFYTTQPRYMKMASHIRSLPPSATQARLTELLGSHIPDGAAGDANEYAKRAQVFLDICTQLQPTHCAQVLSQLLHFIFLYPAEMSVLNKGNPLEREARQQNWEALLWSILQQGLQSLPLSALPRDQRVLLLGRATVMPALLASTDDADRMAIRLLETTQNDVDNADWSHAARGERSLPECIEHMLEKLFSRGSQQSMYRFERIFRTMAHLPPSMQTSTMQATLIRCASHAYPGVTPVLIAATAQVAHPFPQDQRKRLYDLLALCLTPGPFRSLDSHSRLQSVRIDPSEQSAYLHRFELNCVDLIDHLRSATPDAACKLLAGINGAYERDRLLDNILPASKDFPAALYGHFLKQAQAFLESLAPTAAAEYLLQWKIPRRYSSGARSIDD